MRAIKAILTRNLINFARDKMRFIFTVLMSVLFMFVFSFVMKSPSSGIENPMNYLISGVIIMTVFQAALNNSMNILEDISTGYMKEILVSPISRWQISVGQCTSSALISVLQGVIVLVIGLFMGLSTDAVHVIGMVLLMALVGITFSSIGLFLATLAKNSATFQIMISAVAMPLTFMSGAYIPTTVMPVFLRPVVYINPLTYTTAIFRFITLKMENMTTAELVKNGVAFSLHGLVITPYMGLVLIIVISAVFLTLCVNRFNKADFSNVKVFRHH